MLYSHEVSDEKIRDMLSDKDTMKIIESIRIVPKSTNQLCIECNIPTSTAYRKIQKMYDCKIIRRIGTINEAGKKELLYKTNVTMLQKINP